MSYQKAREQTLVELIQAGISYADSLTLLRRATRLQRSAEAICSFAMNEYQHARLEARDKRDEAAVTAIALQYRYTVEFQGDPRGCPFKLIKMVENGYGVTIYVPGRGYPARCFA